MSRVGQYETGMMKDSLNIRAIHKLLRICKRLILICCYVLMFSEVAGDSSVNIFAYIGQAAKLFNIDNDYAEPALYNENGTFIASWNGTTNTVVHMNPHYSGKLYMDKERNIWIFDVERKDAGKYYVKFGTRLERYEVDIVLTVKGSHDYIIGLLITIMILVIIILVILIIIIVLMYKKLIENQICKQIQKLQDAYPGHLKNKYHGNQIREGLINMKGWIQKKLCCQHKFENVSRTQDIVIAMEELSKEDQVHKWLNDHPDFMDKYLGKLTEDQIFKQIQKWDDAYNGLLKNKYLELSKEDQVHKWLNDHPDFMDKYLGKLTGDQICKQIQKWDDAYRGLFENKYLDTHENDHQVVPPTLDELSVTLTQYSGTGIDGNPNQSVSTQEMFNASQHSGEDVNNYQAVIPTLVEPPVTLTETGNEIEGNQMQMSARKMFIESRSLVSDELEENDTAIKQAFCKLAVTLYGRGTGIEDNQVQLDLSSTCNSSSSVTYSEPGHSVTLLFNNNEQDANPEQDMAQDVRVVREDLDSEEKCQEPLLKDRIMLRCK